MRIIGLWLAVTSTLIFSGISIQAQEDWVVSSAHAACLMDHIDAYSASDQSVLMIVLSACPEPDVAKALASLTQNSAVPGIGVLAKDASEMDDVIVYTRDELACLEGLSIDLSGPTSRLPKTPSC